MYGASDLATVRSIAASADGAGANSTPPRVRARRPRSRSSERRCRSLRPLHEMRRIDAVRLRARSEFEFWHLSSSVIYMPDDSEIEMAASNIRCLRRVECYTRPFTLLRILAMICHNNSVCRIGVPPRGVQLAGSGAPMSKTTCQVPSLLLLQMVT